MAFPESIGYVMSTQRELVDECLVDGPRQRSAMVLACDEMYDVCGTIAETFRSRGWRGWASMIDWAFNRSDLGDQMEALVQALLVLRTAPGLGNCVALETLATSFAPFAPPRTSPSRYARIDESPFI